jgi:hypothetical protein
MKINHATKPLRAAFAVVASLFAGGVMTAAASSSIVTFSVDMSTNLANASFNPGAGDIVKVRGTFDGWGNGVVLSQVGSSAIYTNTVNDATDPNGYPMPYVFLIEHPGPSDSYETVADFNNRCTYLPTTSGGSLVLGTCVFGDQGPAGSMNATFQVDMSQEIALGYFTNDVPSAGVEVRGNFNGWTSGALVLTHDPTILRTNGSGLVTSNVYVGTTTISTGAAASPFATSDYKYVIQPGSYEGVGAANADSGGNRFLVFTNGSSQVIPVVFFSDAPFAPIAQVSFTVDMSAVALGDPNYNPATYDVRLDGSFNGWAPDVTCTNDPGLNGNTNLWSCVVAIGAGTPVQYQFRYTDNLGNTQYDSAPGGGNRAYTVPDVASTNLPAVYFNNVLPTDLLNVDTEVTFSVNMTNAVGYPGSGDPNPFDPSSDSVFVNGDFIGWLNWDPISLSSYQLQATPPTSEVYTLTYLFPKGHSRLVTYKYGIDGIDDEAGFAQNHVRYIRSTNGVYNLPLDKFGTQTVEPKIGGLTIGNPSGGNVPVTWLPYPTVLLQSSTDLNSGIWTDNTGTLGQGSASWPVSGGNTFFRLKGQ